jgi:hypothetical protein
VTYLNIVDPSAGSVYANDYRGTGVPLNYVIDRDGKVVDAWAGYYSARIDNALAALADPAN